MGGEMDFFTFHRNIPGWKVDFLALCTSVTSLENGFFTPSEMFGEHVCLGCPCGFSDKELLSLASENPLKKLRKTHIDKKNPLIKLLLG